MLHLIHIRILAVALLILPISNIRAEEQKNGFEIGIAPFLPVKTLVQNYAPLREYLQNQLKEPVTFVSAPDYKSYFKSIQNHEYPIIITTASSAYVAWADYAYVPLLQPLNFTQPVVVVAKHQAFKQLSDLRGKTIAMSDATAIVSMQGLQMLREAGLEPERNVHIKNMQNHSAAVNHVIAGEVAAAIVSNRALMQMAPAVREQIKIVYTWEKGAAPGIVYMGNPDISRDRLEKIKKTILEFSQKTPEGVKLMAEMGYGGLQNIAPADLEKLAPYGALLRNILNTDNK